MTDGPALESGPCVALDLDEIVLLSLWSLDVGRLHKKERSLDMNTVITSRYVDINAYICSSFIPSLYEAFISSTKVHHFFSVQHDK